MKILSLHCDYIKFKPLKKALKNPEAIKNKKEKKVEEVLIVFTAVEKQDEQNPEIVKDYFENIKDIASQVKCKNIVVYPYSHLSSSLSSSEFAQKTLEEVEKKISKSKGFKVIRAPFGYYKQFELKCKGHPLAELSREISLDKTKETDERYDSKQLLRQISRTKLDTRKLKDNDHRILGEKMNLFSFSDVAPGMTFWHDKGMIIYNELIKFWREEHKKADYQEISTPIILDKKLWQISGHWEKYRENIFLTKYEDRDFVVKPMNCPGGMLVFKTSTKSYKDFPLRVAELGLVHRQELSGVLSGLFRVIQFIQDDAHIFCKDEKQVESEISGVIELIEKLYKPFNFKYHVELSTRPKKRIGSVEQWEISEKILEKVLKKKKIKYKINKGEGAFYGSKIDFHIKDSLGRTWQLATIQLDFAMPERFDLFYIDKDNKRKKPIMIHRAIFGSFERFIGILLEHTNGNLPLWLSPIQCRVLSFTDKNIKAAEKIMKKLKSENIRVDSDFESETINAKVRNAELQKIPYIIVIGNKEEKSKTIALRERNKKPQFGINPDNFVKDIKKKIENKE